MTETKTVSIISIWFLCIATASALIGGRSILVVFWHFSDTAVSATAESRFSALAVQHAAELMSKNSVVVGGAGMLGFSFLLLWGLNLYLMCSAGEVACEVATNHRKMQTYIDHLIDTLNRLALTHAQSHAEILVLRDAIKKNCTLGTQTEIGCRLAVVHVMVSTALVKESEEYHLFTTGWLRDGNNVASTTSAMAEAITRVSASAAHTAVEKAAAEHAAAVEVHAKKATEELLAQMAQ